MVDWKVRWSVELSAVETAVSLAEVKVVMLADWRVGSKDARWAAPRVFWRARKTACCWAVMRASRWVEKSADQMAESTADSMVSWWAGHWAGR